MAKRQRFHVTYDREEGGWKVIEEGAAGILARGATKVEAVEAGRAIAEAVEGQLLVHLKSGKIQEERTYGGRDPHPPKG